MHHMCACFDWRINDRKYTCITIIIVIESCMYISIYSMLLGVYIICMYIALTSYGHCICNEESVHVFQ